MIDGSLHSPSRTNVLVADDTASVRLLFQKLLTAEGYHVISVTDGLAALDAVRLHRPDVILLDVGMPGMNGIEVCRRLKTEPATRLTPVVLVTGLSELQDRIKGIEAGADDFLSKPVHPHELRARVASLSRLKHLTDALDSAEAAFMALALTIEARDPTMKGHCERLATHAVTVGRTLGLPADDLDALHRGGYLHDVGKVGVPDSVLLKPGPLTDTEFALMKRHTEIGDSLCAPLQSLRHVRPIVRSHHERLDGSGYPNGLCGDEIPVLAQIVGIVDVYDAMTSHRPYREALDSEAATRLLVTEVERRRFSKMYVEAFLDTLRMNAAPLVH
ncbi:MAG: response regulator [Acidobacteria bacterium]|nr:response regulator [Acidobacteriota bacterium]